MSEDKINQNIPNNSSQQGTQANDAINNSKDISPIVEHVHTACDGAPKEGTETTIRNRDNSSAQN